MYRRLARSSPPAAHSRALTRRLAPAAITALVISGLVVSGLAGTTAATAAAAPAGQRPSHPITVHARPGAGHTRISPNGTARAARRPAINLRSISKQLRQATRSGAAPRTAPRVSPHDARVVSPPTFTANYPGLTGFEPAAATNGTRTIEVAGGSITVFDTAGNQVCATIPLHQILTSPDGFGPGGAQVQYDTTNHRFIMLSVNENPAGGPETGNPEIFLAVSASSDPCGSWFPYQLTLNAQDNQNVLPSLGQDTHAVLISLTEEDFNDNPISSSDFSIDGSVAFAMPKATLYADGAIGSFPTFGIDGTGGLMAATSTGNPMVSSPGGYFVVAKPSNGIPGQAPPPAGYDLYRMDGTGSTAPTFTRQSSFTTAGFTPPAGPDQPGTDSSLTLHDFNTPAGYMQTPVVYDGSRVWFAHTVHEVNGPATTLRYGFITTTGSSTLQYARAGHDSTSADFNPSISVGLAGNGVETVFLNWASTDVANTTPVSPTVAAFLYNGGALPTLQTADTTTVIGGIPTTDQRFSDWSSVGVDPVAPDGTCAVTAQQYFSDSNQAPTQVTRVCGPDSVRVPNVAGGTVAQAQAALHSAFLAGDSVTNTTACTAASNNQVVGTSPAIGQFATIGSEVTISFCNLNVTVPRVIGFDDGSAQRAITAAGLTVGPVSQVSNCNVAKGDVTSQNPGPGPALSGTAVSLSEASGLQSNGKKCVISVS